MCVLPDATPREIPSARTPAASLLPPQQRQHLPLQASASTRPIAQLAHDYPGAAPRNDKAMEVVMSRLKIEPTVTAVRWEHVS
jgi:hypothetical protein